MRSKSNFPFLRFHFPLMENGTWTMDPLVKGFSLIELLLVISLVAILGVSSVAFYSRFFTQNAVLNTADQVKSELRKAQTYAMASKQNGNWGVHYDSNQIVLFQGASYAARNAAFDETFDVPTAVSISGLTDIIFTRITGIPSTTSTITITGANTDRILTLNAQGVVTVTSGAEAWFNTSYLFKKEIRIDHTKVSGGSDLSNFPVLISLTDPTFKTSGNGGTIQDSNGYDIIFTDGTETTKLDHEIEKYVPTTGELQMWVRLPTVSASTDTVLYMYYDNSSISTSQETVATVWDSNYRGVWHMDQNPSGTAPQIFDSTSNALNATSNGSMASGQLVTGKVDGSLSFDGINDYLSRADTTTLEPSGAMTISFWVNLDQTATTKGEDQLFIGKQHSVSPWYSYLVYTQATDNKVGVSWINNSGTEFYTAGTTALAAGSWYYITYVNTGTSGAVYINGSDTTDAVYDPTYSGTLFNSDSYFSIGGYSSTQKRVDGIMDEVQVSAIARSAGWIATAYNNQSTPAAFFSVGSAIGQ